MHLRPLGLQVVPSNARFHRLLMYDSQLQHTPLLATTLEAVGRGRLPHADYPDVKGAPDHAAINGTSAKVEG